MQGKAPTIYDVAKLAGVSIATVSRTTSGGVVSAASRRKVEEAMATLGYRHAADRPRHRGALALAVTDLSNPYYTALADGAAAEAARAGYALQIYASDHLEGEGGEELTQRILAHAPEGAVLVGSMVEDGEPELLSRSVDRLLREMPVVTLCPRVEGMGGINITSDPSTATRKSVAHLVRLGHRRIVLIGGGPDERFRSVRRDSFFEELERLDLPRQSRGLFSTGFAPQSGEAGVARMLAAYAPDERPTAVIAFNDMVALGVLCQLQREGLRVPEDVALVGCDNLFFAPYLNPPLTTVDLHAFEHGQAAVSELVSAVNGGSTFHYSRTRESSLIVRESCGASLVRAEREV